MSDSDNTSDSEVVAEYSDENAIYEEDDDDDETNDNSECPDEELEGYNSDEYDNNSTDNLGPSGIDIGFEIHRPDLQESDNEEINKSEENSELRNIDCTEQASMDTRPLLAFVYRMAQRQVTQSINNIMETLEKKKNRLYRKYISNNEAALKKKIDAILWEIRILKYVDPMKYARFALLNEDTVAYITSLPGVSLHRIALTKVSEDKGTQDHVLQFRAEHKDWRELSHYVISHNSNRHYKGKDKQKRNHSTRPTDDRLMIEKELMELLARSMGIVSDDLEGSHGTASEFSKQFGGSFSKKKNPMTSKPKQNVSKEEKHKKTDTSTSEQHETNKKISEKEMRKRKSLRENDAPDPTFTFNIVESEEDESSEEDVNKHEADVPKTKQNTKQTSTNQLKNEPKELVAKEKEAMASCANILFTGQGETRSEEENKMKVKKNKLAAEMMPGEVDVKEKSKQKKKSAGSVVSIQEGAEITSIVKVNKGPIKRPAPKPLPPVRRVSKNTNMVMKRLNLDLLQKMEASEIPSDTDVKERRNISQPPVKKKKNSFFLGGAEEIDESLAPSAADVIRKVKNFRSGSLNQGVKQKDKKWLTSTFTHRLSANVVPKKSSASQKSAMSSEQLPNGEKEDFQQMKFNNQTDQPSAYTNSHKEYSRDRKKQIQQRNSDSGMRRQSNYGNSESQKKPYNHQSQEWTQYNSQKATMSSQQDTGLHPSWEASKKRQALLASGPKGKKTTFDDDD